MQTAPTQRLCHLCGYRTERRPEDGSYVVDPACPRCLMPFLPPRPVDAVQVEGVLLSMYGIPTGEGFWGPVIQILTHIAPTCEDVERIRGQLHGIDVAELAGRPRTKTRRRVLFDELGDRDVRLRELVRDAESGLLRWRIDQLCRTASAASEARVAHHRRILEATP